MTNPDPMLNGRNSSIWHRYGYIRDNETKLLLIL